jgi:hypothetical protein
MKLKGQASTLLIIVVSVLSGIVVTGAGMTLRGDFLGEREAQAVEQRMDRRLERIEERNAERYRVIGLQLAAINEKLDNP